MSGVCHRVQRNVCESNGIDQLQTVWDSYRHGMNNLASYSLWEKVKGCNLGNVLPPLNNCIQILL